MSVNGLLCQKMREEPDVVFLTPLMQYAEIIILIHIRHNIEIITPDPSWFLSGQDDLIDLFSDVIAFQFPECLCETATPRDGMAHTCLIIKNAGDRLAKVFPEIFIIFFMCGLYKRLCGIRIHVIHLSGSTMGIEITAYFCDKCNAVPV